MAGQRVFTCWQPLVGRLGRKEGWHSLVSYKSTSKMLVCSAALVLSSSSLPPPFSLCDDQALAPTAGSLPRRQGPFTLLQQSGDMASTLFARHSMSSNLTFRTDTSTTPTRTALLLLSSPPRRLHLHDVDVPQRNQKQRCSPPGGRKPRSDRR